jgi:hypothetical protein
MDTMPGNHRVLPLPMQMPKDYDLCDLLDQVLWNPPGESMGKAISVLLVQELAEALQLPTRQVKAPGATRIRDKTLAPTARRWVPYLQARLLSG